MKNSIKFLALALVVAALAAWLPAAAAPAKTLDNLQAAYNGESNAHAKYVAFAQKADEEGYPSVASLFRAAARAEQVHADTHASVIKSMGGVPKADVKAPEVKSTKENLEAAVKGETYERDIMYPEFIATAKAEGNKEALKAFNYAKTAEAEHAKLYSADLKELGDPQGQDPGLLGVHDLRVHGAQDRLRKVPLLLQPEGQVRGSEVALGGPGPPGLDGPAGRQPANRHRPAVRGPRSGAPAMEFPPIPSWDGLHPLIIHFPVALLLVAPLFVVVGVLWKKHGFAFLVAGLLLMAMGTAAAYVAVETGEAAAELADRSPEVNPVLSHHQKLADRTRLVFTGLTALLAVLVFVPALLKKEMKRSLAIPLYAFFLLLYAGGAALLSNTAHNGGRLVHEFGVRALVLPAPGQQASASAPAPSQP